MSEDCGQFNVWIIHLTVSGGVVPFSIAIVSGNLNPAASTQYLFISLIFTPSSFLHITLISANLYQYYISTVNGCWNKCPTFRQAAEPIETFKKNYFCKKTVIFIIRLFYYAFLIFVLLLEFLNLLFIFCFIIRIYIGYIYIYICLHV